MVTVAMTMTVPVVTTMMMPMASVAVMTMPTMAVAAVVMSTMIVASVVVTTMSVTPVVMASVIVAVAMMMAVIKSGRRGGGKCQSCSRDKGSEQKFHWVFGMFLRLHFRDFCSHILRRNPFSHIQAAPLFF
jgi:hypothetical protein